MTRRCVAMVAPCPYPTNQGTQVLIRGLARAAALAGHRVHVVCYGFGEDGVSDDSEVDGLTLHRAPCVPGYRKLRAGPSPGKLPTDLLLARELVKVVRREPVELVHAHHVEGPPVSLPAAALGLPVIFHAHTALAEELHTYFPASLERPLRRLGRVLDPLVPRAADGCIALSEEGAASLGRRAGAVVIPPGVDEADLGVPRPPPPGAPTVVYTGNPDRYQGLPLLFEAMKRVLAALPEARLRIVTHASLDELEPLRRSLPPGACRLDRVRGWAQVQEAVLEAHVAALPRASCPGYPVKLLNYMGLGRPVVACRGSAAALTDGVTGLVVDEDPEAFAQALLRLLRDPDQAQGMGEAARSEVRERHTWPARLPAIEAVWDAVLRSTGRRRARMGLARGTSFR